MSRCGKRLNLFRSRLPGQSNFLNILLHCNLKLYVITPWIFTGTQFRVVGVKRARIAASLAAGVNIGFPDMTCAETTLPCSSTRIWMFTLPCVRVCLAIAG